MFKFPFQNINFLCKPQTVQIVLVGENVTGRSHDALLQHNYMYLGNINQSFYLVIIEIIFYFVLISQFNYLIFQSLQLTENNNENYYNSFLLIKLPDGTVVIGECNVYIGNVYICIYVCVCVYLVRVINKFNYLPWLTVTSVSACCN